MAKLANIINSEEQFNEATFDSSNYSNFNEAHGSEEELPEEDEEPYENSQGSDYQLEEEESDYQPEEVTHKFLFNNNFDLYLLRQASADRPFICSYGELTAKWKHVSDILNSKFKIKTSWKSCRDRFDNLMKKFKNGESISAKSTGASETYEEKKQILTDCNVLISEFNENKKKKDSTKTKNKNEKTGMRREADAILGKAMKTFAEDQTQKQEENGVDSNENVHSKKKRFCKSQEESFMEVLSEQTRIKREELEFKKRIHEEEKEERRKQVNAQQELTYALVRQLDAQKENNAAFISVIRKFLPQ